MSTFPLTSRTPLGHCRVVHPIRYRPPAVSRQFHAPCDLEPFGIGRQLMAAKPACYEMTFRITLSASGEPPFKNIAAILQLCKHAIGCFPVGVALNPSS